MGATGFTWVCRAFTFLQHCRTHIDCRYHGRVRPSKKEDGTMILTRSHFVPNLTMGPSILEWVYKNNPDIYMDCHMMVSDPAQVCLHVL